MDEIQNAEKVIARLKKNNQWPGEGEEWPQHIAAGADDDGAWPIDGISCHLDYGMQRQSRDLWKSTFKKMGFRPELDDGFESSNTYISIRPFGPMGAHQKMVVKVYADKILCQGASKTWAEHLSQRQSSDSPQQRLMKLIFAFIRSGSAGNDSGTESVGKEGKRSRERSNASSREREGKKRKAVDPNVIPTFKMESSDEEDDPNEGQGESVKKEPDRAGPKKTVITRSASKVDIPANEDDDPHTPMKVEKTAGDQGGKFLSDMSPLKSVKTMSPFPTDGKGKVMENKEFMKTAYLTAISIIEGYEMQQWYGKGLDKQGDEKTRAEYNRKLILNKAAYDIVIRPTIAATPNTEKNMSKMETSWIEWHSKANEFEIERHVSSRMADFKDEVKKHAQRLVQVVKVTNDLNDEACLAEAADQAKSSNRKLFENRADVEMGEEKEMGPGYNLRAHRSGISIASPLWEEEIARMKKEEEKERQEERKREKEMNKRAVVRNKAKAEASDLIFDSMWQETKKMVTDKNEAVGKNYKLACSRMFSDRNLSKTVLKQYKTQVAPFAIDDHTQEPSRDLLDYKTVVSKAINKHVTFKMNNIKPEKKKLDWQPGKAQEMLNAFLTEIAGWYEKLKQELDPYKDDLVKRLDNVKQAIEVLDKAKNFSFAMPASLDSLLERQEDIRKPKDEVPAQQEEEKVVEEGEEEGENAPDQSSIRAGGGVTLQFDFSKFERAEEEEEGEGEPKQTECPKCHTITRRGDPICECVLDFEE